MYLVIDSLQLPPLVSDFKTSHRQEVNVPTWPTFTLLGCWRPLLFLLHATSSPLHPLPASEHVIILIRGDLLWILVLGKDAWEEIRERGGVRRDEVKHQERLFRFQEHQRVKKDVVIIGSYLHWGHAVCRPTQNKVREKKKKRLLAWIEAESGTKTRGGQDERNPQLCLVENRL